jgi:hypothetical protein
VFAIILRCNRNKTIRGDDPEALHPSIVMRSLLLLLQILLLLLLLLLLLYITNLCPGRRLGEFQNAILYTGSSRAVYI